MRIARFSIDGNVAFGAVEGDSTGPDGHEGLVLDIIKGVPFADFELSGTKVPLDKVRLLPPVLPSKVVAIGRNYAAHAAELGNEAPTAPWAFFKPSTSVIGPGDPIVYPSFSHEVHHEAELAVVIGRLCREVPRERVKDVILGYTCANDVTARDTQRTESSGPGPRASTPPVRSAPGSRPASTSPPPPTSPSPRPSTASCARPAAPAR
jgi:2-keto-4-pentenoate hydratase/2-oxohepta-3-ene-1,7-dioic acid hydratase in catechol pathway